MGALGSQIGQSFAGTGTAEQLAQRSLGWGALATGIDISSNVASGVAGFQQAQYAAKVAGQNAAAIRQAGQYEESAVKGKFTRLEASQKVAQAANGIDVNSRSAESVRDATAEIGAMDAAMIHYNASREAFGEEAKASLYKRAGAGALAGGLVRAGGSFLSGASSLSGRWLAYKNNVPGYS